MQNFLVFRNSPPESVENVRFMRMQSIRAVTLLIVDVQFIIGKDWLQNVVYMSNETNWSFLLLVRRRRFFIRFCLFYMLFLNFFGIVRFVNTTLDKFQFQRQVGPSQINVPIGLKFKLYAVFFWVR